MAPVIGLQRQFPLRLAIGPLVLATGLALASTTASLGQAGATGGHRYGLPSPRPRAGGAIRLATYNLLNLFDRADDPALRGELDDLPLAVTAARAAKLAEAIRAVDADILALQEVESEAALRWFRDTWLADAGYDHLASIDVGYFRGIECSVMSRFPITAARTWPEAALERVRREGPGWSEVPPDRAGALRFRRSPLRVDVEVDRRYRLRIFVVHHKSGRDFSWHREAEALAVVELVNESRRDDPSANIVVLGDFNAAPWDKSFRVYLEAGLVDTLAHRIIPRSGRQSQEEARLYKTHESGRVLDYILLESGALRELVIGSAHVYGTLTPPDSYDWRTDPHPPGYASDHYPVIVDLVPRDRR